MRLRISCLIAGAALLVAAAGETADPPVWLTAAYYGGGQRETGERIAIDRAGNIYLAGMTASADFHPDVPLPPSILGELPVAWFLMKLDRAGRLVYATRVSTGFTDVPIGVAVDRQGAAYVAITRRGFTDVLKFDPTGSRRVYEVTFGGPALAALRPGGLAVTNAGEAVVAGVAVQGRPFVRKLNADGAVAFHVEMSGGARGAEVRDVAIDGEGNTYLVGQTASDDFPTTSPLQPRQSGGVCVPLGPQPLPFPCRDAILVKLDPTGGVVSSTYLGGTGDDGGVAVAVDRQGAVLVAGTTESRDFPIVNAWQGNCRAGFVSSRCGDLFLARITPGGTSLAFSTFVGATGSERCCGVGVDANGIAYLAASTSGTDFPTHRAARSGTAGARGGLVAAFTPAGRVMWSTYVRAGRDEEFAAMALAGRTVHVVGSTSSSGNQELFLGRVWDPRGR